MNQKRKNIRLMILWVVLMIITVLTYFLSSPQDRLDVPRTLFAVEDPSAINRVELSTSKERNTLVFDGYNWQLNEEYTADPQRVTVLFAILKQNKVRRRVAKAKKAQVDSLISTQGVRVEFFQGTSRVKAFDVVSEQDGSLTYFGMDNEFHVVEIPGYRVNLGGIFSLDQNGWRNPLVFDVNWTNLEEVKVIYPEDDDSFDITYNSRYYGIQQLTQTDSAKLTDFLDDVSLLYVEDYLYDQELNKITLEKLPIATIIVNTLGDQNHTVEFFRNTLEEDQVIGRIDSIDYALFEYEKVRKLLRPRRYFIQKG